VYRESFTDENSRLSHYLSVASNPFYGGRLSSFSSLPGRRGSSVSVLSERRSSLTTYLTGRRFSDVSIMSDPKLNGSRIIDATALSHFVPKREIMFSPINEEVETTDQQENTAHKQSPQIKIISDHGSMKGSDMLGSRLLLELLEEPTLPKLITYKCTAV